MRPVDPRHETRPWMRERDPATRKREADLAGMHVAREDEIERRARNPLDDTWEMAQQEAKCPPGVSELIRTRALCPVGFGSTPTTQTGSPRARRFGLVSEQPRPLEIAELCRAREGIAGYGDVMVAEHDERVVERREQ